MGSYLEPSRCTDVFAVVAAANTNDEDGDDEEDDNDEDDDDEDDDDEEDDNDEWINADSFLPDVF